MTTAYLSLLDKTMLVRDCPAEPMDGSNGCPRVAWESWPRSAPDHFHIAMAGVLSEGREPSVFRYKMRHFNMSIAAGGALGRKREIRFDLGH
jgi:hypothetical protein